ncbi:MAG: hypothetical protein LBM07_02490, partial [Culturomica sp.]|nr:hypothetical protein [Culturomica sp.]
MQKLISYLRADLLRTSFIFLIAVMFVAMPLMSRHTGMSGDDKLHWQQAEYVVKFYETFGADESAIKPLLDGYQREYGLVAYTFAAFITNVFGIEDWLEVSHTMAGLMGWLGILFASLFAFRVSNKNWWAAILTALLFFFSPRYMGHSHNNLLDISFAAFTMMGIYYIYRFIEMMPKPSIKVCIGLAAGIGLATATRVGGLLLIAYFGLFALVWFFIKWNEIIRTNKLAVVSEKSKKGTNISLQSKKEVRALFLRVLYYGLGISVAGYLLAIIVWPYVLVSPIKNMQAVFATMSQIPTSLRQLFGGQMVWSNHLPWYYTPQWILMTIPVAVIFGMLAYIFVGGLRERNLFSTFVVYFTFLFPVFWICYTNANVYGGWRHSLFTYPTMVVAAGLGFTELFQWVVNTIKSKFPTKKILLITYLGCGIFFTAMLWSPIRHTFVNHPYEYVYFNELVGGAKGAYGNYEMDYYYHTTRDATEWVMAHADTTNLKSGEKIKIASWHVASVNYFIRHDTAHFQSVFTRWLDRGDRDWDYAIFTVTGIHPEQLKGKYFPPKNCVHTIDVDGKPISIILKREDKSDMIGYNFKQKNVADSAVIYLNKALEKDPYNDAALLNLLEVYLVTDQLKQNINLLKHAKQYMPKIERLRWIEANYYLNVKDYDNAEKIAKDVLSYNNKMKSFYRILANIYIQKRDLAAAERTYVNMIEHEQIEQQDFNTLIQIYKMQGLSDAWAQNKL